MAKKIFDRYDSVHDIEPPSEADRGTCKCTQERESVYFEHELNRKFKLLKIEDPYIARV